MGFRDFFLFIGRFGECLEIRKEGGLEKICMAYFEFNLLITERIIQAFNHSKLFKEPILPR